MKLLILSAVLLSAQVSTAQAAQDCKAMAITAAQQMYSLGEGIKMVTKAQTQTNPANTSSGVSLIVTLNDSERFLVLMTGEGPAPASQCRMVHYVISYPFANLIRQ